MHNAISSLIARIAARLAFAGGAYEKHCGGGAIAAEMVEATGLSALLWSGNYFWLDEMESVRDMRGRVD